MPELPLLNPLLKSPLWKRGVRGDFVNKMWIRLAGVHSIPLCAHPAQRALAGSQAYLQGLPDEVFISGWANVQANNYWSSTTNANNTDNAWNVNMWNGNVNNDNKDNNNYVWPVRAGEWENTPHPDPLPQGERGIERITHLHGEMEFKLSTQDKISPPLTGGVGESVKHLFSFENLYRCYLKCRRNKRNTINALRFEVNAEENLFKLSEELTNKTYQPSRSVCFVVERPKMREIVAADFRDRVVHHLLVERLETIYEPVFIYDSYACRKNKGLHKAIERVREFIRKCSANGKKKIYFLHLDIRNFFMTIDREILFQMLKKKLDGLNHYSENPPLSPFSKGGFLESPLSRGDIGVCSPLWQREARGDFSNNLLYLAHTIIFHNPADNCIIKGKKEFIKHLPQHKSLFFAPNGKGLPVGNLTSQFFANVYLNELDQFVKHTLKCRYYVRYCDDFLILDESPERLKEIKERISEFVADKLNLSLNERYNSVVPVSNGIDFLGYIIRKDYMLVRRRVVNNLKSKLGWFEKRLISEKDGVQVIRYDYELLEQLRSVLASYLGHLKWADSYNLRSAIFEKYGFLKEYFSFDDGRVKPLYRYCGIFPSVRSQYLYYSCKFRDMVIFFQTGCFYEFYGEIKDEVKNILCLKRLKNNQRGAMYGFPVRLGKEYLKRLIEKGIPVIIVKETGRYIGRIKERLPEKKIMKKKMDSPIESGNDGKEKEE